MITTAMRHENHEVSRVGIRDCGSYDARGCYDERHNAASDDQGGRLIIEWTADL